MPATAAARRVAASPARRATASRPALKARPRTAPTRRAPQRGAGRHPAPRSKAAPKRGRRRSNTPVTGFVPVVVGRTAGAVGGIADSGFVVRMTRGRLWIGVLGVLLVGIVGLNVWALSLNASSSKVARQADGLKRANSALQAQIAGELSNEQVQGAATKAGLIVPEPGSIRYLGTGGNAAAIAARRLQNGAFTLGAASVPVEPIAPAIVPEEPVTPETEVPPVTPDPAATDPAAVAPVDTAAPVTTPAGTGGGVTPP